MYQPQSGNRLNLMSNTINYISEICRLYVFVLLIVAAWGKSNTFNLFQQNLMDSFHIPKKFSKFVALTIIGLEWLLAIFLLANSSWTKLSMLLTLILFITFTATIGILLIKDKVINCNCFGRTNRPISFYDLFRNLILIAASGYHLVFSTVELSFEPITYLQLFGVAVILFLITTSLYDISLLIRYQDKGPEDG